MAVAKPAVFASIDVSLHFCCVEQVELAIDVKMNDFQ